MDSGAELRTMRMVDVEEMCVVDAPGKCRYLALSYVWRKARGGIFTLKRGNKTALMTRGGLFPARWSIPDTVWDAVQFVKGIRERYLWVDSLCIYSDRSLIKHLGNSRCLLPHFEEWSKWYASISIYLSIKTGAWRIYFTSTSSIGLW